MRKNHAIFNIYIQTNKNKKSMSFDAIGRTINISNFVKVFNNIIRRFSSRLKVLQIFWTSFYKNFHF